MKFHLSSIALTALSLLQLIEARPHASFSGSLQPSRHAPSGTIHATRPFGYTASRHRPSGSAISRHPRSGTAPASGSVFVTASSFGTSASSESSSVAVFSSTPITTSSTFVTSMTTSSTSSSTTSSSTASIPITTSSSSTSTSSAVTPTAQTHIVANTGSAMPDVIRGVNIGGWLVLEPWLDGDLFDGNSAPDQWTFDSQPGAAAKLQQHWSTFFTESDVAKIASWGINSLRIPIGFWAYDNSNTPYVTGADAYLDQAIGWARTYGLKVLIDLHGVQGSQNGWFHSGHQGTAAWQTGNNQQQTINVLKTMAAKYGSMAYADVVFGIELVNEPISWAPNNAATLQSWAAQAYTAVKAAAANPNLTVVMHDGFMGAAQWTTIGAQINNNAPLASSQFMLDLHLYQNQEAADSLLTQAQHITKACGWATSALLPSSANLPVMVGEFSAATNICANPDGSTLAGSTCYVNTCQCSSNVPVQYWNPWLVTATRMFLEAQMDAFEHASKGWFMWTYNGPGAWGLANAVQYGLVGAKVTDRAFPNQCGF